jgi:hypothetical protein
MDKRLELLTLLLFLAGATMQFWSRTFSVEGVALATVAIALPLTVRLWARLRRGTLELAINANQGDTGRRDATEHRHLD